MVHASENLLTLDLSNARGSAHRKNCIQGDAAAKIAVSLLKNRTLTSLSLRGNLVGRVRGRLSDRAAEAFANTLMSNRSLTHLDVASNELSTRACSTLMVNNRRLDL